MRPLVTLLMALSFSAALSLAGRTSNAQLAGDKPSYQPAEHYVVWWGGWEPASAIVTESGLVARRLAAPLLTVTGGAWTWASWRC